VKIKTLYTCCEQVGRRGKAYGTIMEIKMQTGKTKWITGSRFRGSERRGIINRNTFEIEMLSYVKNLNEVKICQIIVNNTDKI
jgi:hypothetical protein